MDMERLRFEYSKLARALSLSIQTLEKLKAIGRPFESEVCAGVLYEIEETLDEKYEKGKQADSDTD